MHRRSRRETSPEQSGQSTANHTGAMVVSIGHIIFSTVGQIPCCEPIGRGAFARGNLHGFLASTDTIQVPAVPGGPTVFRGRVVHVVENRNTVPNDEAIHPIAAGENYEYRNFEFLRVQLHITNQCGDQIGAEANWGTFNPNIFHEIPTLPQAAPTNCIVWVPVSLICNLCFFIHTDDCENQTYGSIIGRNDHYHVRKVAIFTGHDNSFEWGPDIEDNNQVPYHYPYGYPPQSNYVSKTES